MGPGTGPAKYDECEFWSDKDGDCRIRKCLELLQKVLEAVVKK